MQVRTVSQITAYIRDLFDTDAALQDLWVEGEVSNCSRPPSGHIYFTLKDPGAEIACVLWRSKVAALDQMPADGQAVMVHGYVSVYEAKGRYQLYVDWLQWVGEGALFLRLQRLKDQLESEGLFAAERKRPLPTFPRKVGVVTSPVGAAVRDILQILERRFPLAEVVVAPSQVQGEDAPPQIVAALETLNAHTDVDVIIVARGGGSLEELWAFNDERVARAIFASRVPVVSGVGHETDYTIADFVADLRAPTPSAAAELVVPDQEELRLQIEQYQGSLFQAAKHVLSECRSQASQALTSLRRLSPRAMLDRWRQRLDERQQRMAVTQKHRLMLLREQLLGMHRRLEALSPQSVLDRGYSVVSHHDSGAVVRSTTQVSAGDAIDVRVSDGRFKGTVDAAGPIDR